MSFQDLPLGEMYDRLSKLRMAAIFAVLGDDEALDKVIGDIVDETPGALVDGEATELADAVDAWLAGGAA